MADELVINTGPLIAFDRMGCLDQIGRLPFVFVCPEEVRRELDEGEAAGHPRIAPPWLAVRALSSAPPKFGLVELDLGETAAIQLALEAKPGRVAIDEWKGRRMALAMGLKVVGSLGLLGRAKQLGLILEVRPFIQRAIDAGIRYHPALVSALLRELGEI
jgi:predicted nucleic acid-binding protein